MGESAALVVDPYGLLSYWLRNSATDVSELLPLGPKSDVELRWTDTSEKRWEIAAILHH